jgi:hypothetical protein
MTTDARAEILHEHYRDTCGVMQGLRASRDRCFYLVIAVLAAALFDVATPQGFATAVGDLLKIRLGLSNALDLAYVRSVLWFLLLGLTLRYSQLTLNLERQYGYIHQLEQALQEVVHPAFRREGRAYLEDYPRFLTWAHFLYTVVFPLLLCVVALCWTYRQFPTWPWPWAVWFNLAVTVLLLVSVGLYLQTLHRERLSHGIAWWRAWWSARAKPSQAAEKSDGATQSE